MILVIIGTFLVFLIIVSISFYALRRPNESKQIQGTSKDQSYVTSESPLTSTTNVQGSSLIPLNSTIPTVISGNTMVMKSPTYVPPKIDQINIPLISSDPVKIQQIWTGLPASTQIITQPITQSNTQSNTQPITQSNTQSNTQPITQSNTQSNTQPVVQAITQPVVQPVMQSSSSIVVSELSTSNQAQTSSLLPTVIQTRNIWASPNYMSTSSGGKQQTISCPNNGKVTYFNVDHYKYVNNIAIGCGDDFTSNYYGTQGGYGRIDQPRNASGFSQMNIKSGSWIDSIQFPEADNDNVLGGAGGNDTSNLNCGPESYITGLMLDYGDHIYKIGAVCADIQPISNEPYDTKVQWATQNFAQAKPGPNSVAFECPNNEKVTKFNIKSGNSIDAIGVECEKGNISPLYGGMGGGLKTITTSNPNGFQSIIVNFEDWINSIQFPGSNNQSTIGGQGTGRIQRSDIDCGKDSYVHGIYVNYGDAVNKLGAVCMTPK